MPEKIYSDHDLKTLRVLMKKHNPGFPQILLMETMDNAKLLPLNITQIA